jgi:F-type H+-transporting ATPase subunit b
MHTVIAASSGNFLITPDVGLMIWTLLLFGLALLVLGKAVFPRISAALDVRQRAIADSIDTAERTRVEAEQLLAEYRERLKEARVQADELVARARKTAEDHEREASEEARVRREELLEQTRRDVAAETNRALAQIRAEVAELTIQATERVTRKVLNDADQRRLVDDVIGELDFSALSSGAED